MIEKARKGGDREARHDAEGEGLLRGLDCFARQLCQGKLAGSY